MNFQNFQYKNSTLLAVNQKVAIRITIVAAGDNHIQRNQSLAAITQVAFKNSSPFKDWRTETNDTFVEYTDFINIAMFMYSLIEYSDNYSKT